MHMLILDHLNTQALLKMCHLYLKVDLCVSQIYTCIDLVVRHSPFIS